MKRRRNTILSALEMFRDKTPNLWANNIVTFLYVCENEGVNLKELAAISRLSEPTASRSIRSFTEEGVGPTGLKVPLVEMAGHPSDGRSKVLFLTPAGQEFARELDALIQQARPIYPQDA